MWRRRGTRRRPWRTNLRERRAPRSQLWQRSFEVKEKQENAHQLAEPHRGRTDRLGRSGREGRVSLNVSFPAQAWGLPSPSLPCSTSVSLPSIISA